MKYIALLSILVLTACASTEKLHSPAEAVCMDTCAEQGLKLWDAKADGVCECYKPVEREIGPRGSDRL